MTKCYVFYCKSRAEKKAASVLQQAGFEVFMPIIKELRVWSDRKKWIESPLFNSYLFVYCQLHEIYTVKGFPQIVAPVKMAGDFAYLSNKDILTIQFFINNGYNIEVTDGIPEPGEKLIITQGPFKDITGEFVRQKGVDKFCLKLEVLNKSIWVEIPSAITKPTKKV
jgi:transcriptional antiterminator NusG